MFETKQPLGIDAVVTVKCKTPYDNENQIDVNNYTLAIINGLGTKTYSHLPEGQRTVNAVFAGNDTYVGSNSIVEYMQVNKSEPTISVDVISPVIAK